VAVGRRALEDVGLSPEFWRGRRVLLTGHTGFKGSWLALWLHGLGAEVTGYSLAPPTEPSLFDLARVAEVTSSLEADVRDRAALERAFAEHEPEVVYHMAAQSLVRRSYADPVETYETNVLGTVNVLEAARSAAAPPRVLINVTTDKVYENLERDQPFTEDEPKGGHDPYSNSKACSELVTAAYRDSFFATGAPTAVATARAGNVIGGGDWGEDRLVPDLVRGALAGVSVPVRSPDAIRPWQHVLNPLSGYLALAESLWESPGFAGAWNFGPDSRDELPVRHVADRLSQLWEGRIEWHQDEGEHPHEAHYLRLDSSKARTRLGWAPRWDLEHALESIAAWHAGHAAGEEPRDLVRAQIEDFAAATAATER
jgi:CDP-glucose 4,6-dehydratase